MSKANNWKYFQGKPSSRLIPGLYSSRFLNSLSWQREINSSVIQTDRSPSSQEELLELNKLSIDCRCYLLIGSPAINPLRIAPEWLFAGHTLIELTREYTKALQRERLLCLSIYIYPYTNVTASLLSDAVCKCSLESERDLFDWGCWSRTVPDTLCCTVKLDRYTN